MAEADTAGGAYVCGSGVNGGGGGGAHGGNHGGASGATDNGAVARPANCLALELVLHGVSVALVDAVPRELVQLNLRSIR
jgi:hypothetical protein